MLMFTASSEKTGLQQQRIEQLLVNLADELSQANGMNMPVLMKGNAGISLFFAYYYLHTKEDKYLDQCTRLAEEAISWLEKIDMPSMLASGFTGIAWLIKHFINLGIFSTDTDDLLDDIDRYVAQSLERDFHKNDYDLFYGYMGKAVYFLEREHRNNCTLYYQQIVAQVLRSVEQGKHGYYWKANNDLPEINLGLAHGSPGVLKFLAGATSHIKYTEEIQIIIAGATRWLLRQRNPPGNISFFPNSTSTTPLSVIDSRLAWCYGDLGIALTLVKVNKLLQDEQVRLFIDELLQALSQRSFETAFLKYDEILNCYDNCFCHGASGIAYLFHKLYRETNDEGIYRKYLEWAEIAVQNTAAMLANLGNIEKRKEVINDKLVTWEDYTLIHGLAGAGLVLISLMNPQLSAWDSIFLLD